MIAKLLPAWVSTRVYLALGLSSLTVTLVLAAGLLGLLPDTDEAERRHRAALAETVALAASLALDDTQPELAQATLDYLRQRHPVLLSLGMRRADGPLLAATAGHAAAPTAGAPPPTDQWVSVPVYRADQRWGEVELAMKPVRAPGWRGWLASTELRLGAFMGCLGFVAFLLYLRRMLSHLDPSRAVPQRVRHALDTLTEGLLVLDGKGRIVLANQSLAGVLGLAADALLGRAARDFHWTDGHGQRIAADALPWQQALAQQQVQRNQILYITRPGGERCTFRTNCSPIIGPDGRLQGVLASLQDVTELEHTEIALRAAKHDADAANQAKSQFLANMSHEIRTPMNAILGFTDVLRRGALARPVEAARHLDIIHASGRHLLNLINDILDLSKVEAGRMEVERIAFAPHTVAHEVLQTLEVRAQEKGLALTLDLPQALPPTLLGDPARLRQILTNLIGNALKFTERGAVTLRLRSADAHYVFDIIDTGIGIAPDKLDSVFEPFTQAEASTTRRFGGTGLGLTISRGFARAMGGDIVAHSVLGQGTTFSCRLPMDRAATPARQDWLAPAQLRAAATRAATESGQRWRFDAKRVLVVDDGAENRQLVRIVLEEVGLQVEEAENGQVAVDRVTTEAFDLVLMDMQMPVMDGLTATRTMREAGLRLPILALTANAMKGFEQAFEGSGFDGFLTKPIDIDRLIAALAERLGGRLDTAGPGPQAQAEALVLALAQAPDSPQDLLAGAENADVMAAAPLRSRLAGHARLGALANRFAAQLPDRLAQMRAALNAADLATLAALAHGVKGAGGSMGFDDLFDPSRALEDAARAGDASGAAAALRQLEHLGGRIAVGLALAAPVAEEEPA
jgi:PAS domain S-box-containing protein